MDLIFDLSKFTAAFDSASAQVLSEVKKTLKSDATEVQRTARKKHWFHTRTGTLEDSIQTNYDNIDSLVAKVHIDAEVMTDKGLAAYGPYVHEGHGTWEPDQFVYAAAAGIEDRVQSDIEKAITRGLQKAGI